MAAFGNNNKRNANRVGQNIFQHPEKVQSKKYEAEPILSNQRPAPWLGRNILAVLTVGFLLTITGLAIYKILNPS